MDRAVLSERRSARAVLLASLVLVVCVYAQVRTFDFVLFDDDVYVTENPLLRMQDGAIAESFRFRAANWHPLTWMSHLLDVRWFGFDAGAHHLMNVVLHLLNAVVLVIALQRLTGAFLRSAIAGAFFAVHPLNVENVAWVSERKTLLATLFVFAGLALYAEWRRRGGRAWLWLVYLAHALAVMAKPIAVVFPVLLLCSAGILPAGPPASSRHRLEGGGPAGWKPALPLFAISALSAILTYLAQRAGGAVVDTVDVPVIERFANAAISVFWYLAKAVWPSNLSFFYPHAATLGEHVNLLLGALAAVVLLAITVAARRNAGWLWFLVALAPVIGIIQVGGQSRADRYAYLPLVGVFVAVTWGCAALARKAPRVTAAVVAVWLVLLAFAAYRQTAHWRDSATLFLHGVTVDEKNWIAWGDLGLVYLREERLDEARYCFARSLGLNARNANAAFNIGYVCSLQGRHREAAEWYRRTLAMRPGDERASLGLALASLDLARSE